MDNIIPPIKVTMWLATDDAGLGQPVLVSQADLNLDPKPGTAIYVRHPTCTRGYQVSFKFLKHTKVEALTAQVRYWREIQDNLAKESTRIGDKIAVALNMIDAEARKVNPS